MDIFKDWIRDICVSILFMTAVELVLPENSIKKYAKFVLGLIFIVVVINPIIGFVNQDRNLYKDITLNEDYVNRFNHYLEDNLDDYAKKVKKTTLDNFRENLERNCESILRNKFTHKNFSVNATVSFEEEKFKIDEISVRVYNQGVKDVETIEKVIIGNGDKNKLNNVNNKYPEIKKFLSGELKVSESIIKVY